MMHQKIEQFATSALWTAMADIPHVYGLAAAKGALNALRREIERVEKGLPPLLEGDDEYRRDCIRKAILGEQLPKSLPSSKKGKGASR